MTPFFLSGARVFDGERFHHGVGVAVADGRIAGLFPDDAPPAGFARHAVAGLLAPGFIDVQVNGGGGVLFNAERSVAGIAAIGAAHRKYGTTGFLPTFITGAPDHMAEAIAASEAAVASVPGALGIHVEGPFINPERKGVHDPRFIRPIGEDDIALLSAPRAGRTLVTLAPEMVPVTAIERLAAAGVILAAGHTAARHADVVAARRAGLRGFTHLFNAMPPLAGREPGPVGAAMDDAQAYVSIIADLHHVSAPSLRAAIAAHGVPRMMIVSDAMPTVGTDLDGFVLDGRRMHRRGGKLTDENGVLAGADIDMASSVRNAVSRLGLPLEAALAMASRWPAEFLGLDGELGRIVPGYRASLALLDEELAVQGTWIDGAAE